MPPTRRLSRISIELGCCAPQQQPLKTPTPRDLVVVAEPAAGRSLRPGNLVDGFLDRTRQTVRARLLELLRRDLPGAERRAPRASAVPLDRARVHPPPAPPRPRAARTRLGFDRTRAGADSFCE